MTFHPDAHKKLRDFECRGVKWQPPIHDAGLCPACDAWRIQAGGVADRETALTAWCEREDYDPSDTDAPHVKAFLAGYEAGTSRASLRSLESALPEGSVTPEERRTRAGEETP